MATAMKNNSKKAEFYRELFVENPLWSKPFPNPDEADRCSKICNILSRIALSQSNIGKPALRILEVGCGRGWLIPFARVFGQVEGVDPVPTSIEVAKRNNPDITFYVGTTSKVLKAKNFKPYDIIISTEVVEHVEDEFKAEFIEEIVKCLVSGGHLILTTPRGEYYQKWLRLGIKKQIVEEWLSESELKHLMESHDFYPITKDRIYLDLRKLSLLHRICASSKFTRLLRRIKLTWVQKGLQYALGFYQVWWFQLKKG